jgi:hypothetical protein
VRGHNSDAAVVDDPRGKPTAVERPLVLDLSEPARPPISPGTANAGNRLFFVILFWFALVASVEVWWLDNPRGSITDAASALIAAGRITGMIGGFVLLVEVLMMSRVAWLEHWVGAHDLLIWHR